MKRIQIIGAILGVIIASVIGYLMSIGYNIGVEASSTGNVVKFSSPALASEAVQLSSSFSPAENVTVHIEGLFAGEGALDPDELNLKIEMIGHYRRKLFDSSEHFVCSRIEMKNRIRDHLIKLTGDNDLNLRNLRLAYLSEN